LLDRIDIHLEIPALKVTELLNESPVVGESSEKIRERVVKARAKQRERFAGTKIHCNAQMNSRHLKKFCGLSQENKELMRAAIERLGFSGRTYDRILKVSRTIADLEGSAEIKKAHVAEAIQYRNLDRN
jgi:magnesium chelatase family protein